MKKLFDLMKVDFITMNGGKNNMRTIFIFLFIFCGLFGFLITPIFGIYCPMLMGGLFVPTVFKNERKYHSEKLHCLLPVKKQDVVKARFMMILGLYTILSLLFYMLMLIAIIFNTYYLFWGEEAMDLEFLTLLAECSGGTFTKFSLFNLIYLVAFAFGMMMAAGTLRKHFKDNKTMELSFKKITKKEYIIFLAVVVMLIIWVMIVSGILPVGTAVSVLMQLVIQLAESGGGFLLGAILLTMALFSVSYKYICTVLEYDEKEL
ncbi:MAG: ABC-2 transporter permease [Ruminococcus sp.]|nr:ABC-2 transporter permease [Ruminococcus sp.]